MKAVKNSTLWSWSVGLIQLNFAWFVFLFWEDLGVLIPFFLIALFPFWGNRTLFVNLDRMGEEAPNPSKKGWIQLFFSVTVVLTALSVIILCLLREKIRISAPFSWGISYTVGYLTALFLIPLLIFSLNRLLRKFEIKGMRYKRSFWGGLVIGWSIVFQLCCVMAIVLSVKWLDLGSVDNNWLIGLLTFSISLFYMGYSCILECGRPKPFVHFVFLFVTLWLLAFAYLLVISPLWKWILPRDWAIGTTLIAFFWMTTAGALLSEWGRFVVESVKRKKCLETAMKKDFLCSVMSDPQNTSVKDILPDRR